MGRPRSAARTARRGPANIVTNEMVDGPWSAWYITVVRAIPPDRNGEIMYHLTTSAPDSTDYQQRTATTPADVYQAALEMQRTPSGHVNGVRITDESGAQYQLCHRHDDSPRLEKLDGSECGAPPDDFQANDEMRCECGSVTGEMCAYAGPEANVVVEWMPHSLRSSHDAARNRGVYPHNGAERLRVHPDCAELIVGGEDGWAEIL